METEWRCDDVTGDGWRVTVTGDGWWSDEVMECLEMAEMAEMAETLVEGLGGMEWELD